MFAAPLAARQATHEEYYKHKKKKKNMHNYTFMHMHAMRGSFWPIKGMQMRLSARMVVNMFTSVRFIDLILIFTYSTASIMAVCLSHQKTRSRFGLAADDRLPVSDGH